MECENVQKGVKFVCLMHTFSNAKIKSFKICFFYNLRKIKLEVKLPCADWSWAVSIFVHERESNLNDLEQINITCQHLILVFSCTAELTNRPCHYPRKFSILQIKFGHLKL